MQEQQLLQQQQQQHLLLLHHQQQQQQMQMQIQRNSPPPGYRSSLDVSGIASTSILSCNRGAPDGMDTASDGNGNLSNTTSSGNIYVQRKQFTNNNNNNDNKVSVNTGGNAILNIKKGFTAQSCCSLQRAEVENMWHAAAAAVVARAAHTTTTTSASTSNANATNEQAMTVTTPTILRARKSLPSSYGGAKLSVNEISRRYLQPHNYYQRGCPLCGKFCYEVDDTFSLSTESGLDNPTTCGNIAIWDVENLKANGNNAVGDNNCSACTIFHNANNNYNNVFLTKSENEEVTTEQNNTGTTSLPLNVSNEIFFKPEQSIPSTTLAPTTIAAVAKIATNNEQTTATVDVNGNNNENDTAATHNNANSTENQNDFSMMNTDLDTNANASLEPAVVPAATSRTTTTLNTDTPTTTAENVHTDNLELNLDSINENGIVRLDMSKIIDKTGLPTYEAALKLESSGYV
ncbi:uncharacterized protein DDB_G0283357-like [Teleopsis dalmanni]|uniref:uncharacterized protein DDB_G0283357-like n=1 Tax=Teleopsis dalmanni TaxID=139649 RepID=UPI0018CC7FCA|nr:uncharacterized protein DDB_G0283357-like [Teleopsis dalmanni]